MLILGVVAICILLFLLALLVPRLSRGPQRAVDRGFGGAAHAAS
jgi:type II secretory pathway pseudopilin PulG